MAVARSKRSASPAEPDVVETPRKPTRPKAAAKPKPAAPRKRTATPATQPGTGTRAIRDAVPERVEPAPLPAAPAPVARTRRILPPLGWLLLLFVSLTAAGAMLFVAQWDRSAEQPPTPLAAFAEAQDDPVYWAGAIASRQLELTRTADGTFVRYLPAGVEAGDSGRALTVATYPMQDAYATATLRARSRATISRRISGGGIAVWSKAEPTSVYIAFPRIPHLVEVYAPDADEARRLALSGNIAPVR